MAYEGSNNKIKLQMKPTPTAAAAATPIPTLGSVHNYDPSYPFLDFVVLARPRPTTFKITKESLRKCALNAGQTRLVVAVCDITEKQRSRRRHTRSQNDVSVPEQCHSGYMSLLHGLKRKRDTLLPRHNKKSRTQRFSSTSDAKLIELLKSKRSYERCADVDSPFGQFTPIMQPIFLSTFSDEKRLQFEIETKVRLHLRQQQFNLHSHHIEYEQLSQDLQNFLTRPEGVPAVLETLAINVPSPKRTSIGDNHMISTERVSEISVKLDDASYDHDYLRSFVPIAENEYSKTARPRRLSVSDGCDCEAFDGSACDSYICAHHGSLEECGDRCACGSSCRNRQFQNHENATLKVMAMGEKGFGVVAKEAIPKGSFIIEYLGEVISREEWHERNALNYTNGAQPNEHPINGHRYFLYLDSTRVIDATFKGDIGRFVNHSCSPNAFLTKWKVNGYERVGIFAMDDIFEGEEITYDYNYAHVSEFEPLQRCLCGAVDCRRWLGTNEKTRYSNKDVKRSTLISRPVQQITSITGLELRKLSSLLVASTTLNPEVKQEIAHNTEKESMLSFPQATKCLHHRFRQHKMMTGILNDSYAGV